MIKYIALLALMMPVVMFSQQVRPHVNHATKKDSPNWCTPSEWGGMNVNGVPYQCVADNAGPVGQKGHWEVDQPQLEEMHKEAMHKQALADALTSRVLTSEEMAEVLKYGYALYIQNMQPYFEEQIMRRFALSLDIQASLRRMNQCVKSDATGAGHE